MLILSRACVEAIRKLQTKCKILYLFRISFEVDDEVNLQVEGAVLGGELEPLVEHLVLTAQHLASAIHVLHEAVASTEDGPFYQLDWLPGVENVVLQHRQLDVRLEWQSPPAICCFNYRN